MREIEGVAGLGYVRDQGGAASGDFIYSSLPGYIFFAYFGNNAESLYDAMANL